MVGLPEGWGKGKPMKRRPEKKLKYIYFDGGPNDGQLIRWQEDYWPPFWNHVVREINPVRSDEEMPHKSCIVGEGKMKDGTPCLLQEHRILHRYGVTTEVRVDGSQVYRPVGGPVPIEWDDAKEEWKDPSTYDVDKDDNPLTQSRVVVDRKEEDGTEQA